MFDELEAKQNPPLCLAGWGQDKDGIFHLLYAFPNLDNLTKIKYSFKTFRLIKFVTLALSLGLQI